MQITFRPELTRQNEDDQTVYWILTDDSGYEYQWWGDVPKGIDIQKHLEAHMDEYILLIRRREYPGKEIEKVPWLVKHPVDEGILKRALISTETKTDLIALRKSDPQLTPIINVLIGSK